MISRADVGTAAGREGKNPPASDCVQSAWETGIVQTTEGAQLKQDTLQRMKGRGMFGWVVKVAFIQQEVTTLNFSLNVFCSVRESQVPFLGSVSMLTVLRSAGSPDVRSYPKAITWDRIHTCYYQDFWAVSLRRSNTCCVWREHSRICSEHALNLEMCLVFFFFLSYRTLLLFSWISLPKYCSI